MIHPYSSLHLHFASSDIALNPQTFILADKISHIAKTLYARHDGQFYCGVDNLKKSMNICNYSVAVKKGNI
jgi:hypothetical protein